MNFIRQMISVFNFQTTLLLVGTLLIVAGVWLLLGYQIGLIALGIAMVAIALLVGYQQKGG
ncbi:Hypothetical protein ADU71_0445 [Pediococcus damnosus]|uniref:hypothetical protein n=1 Tax=Pediococcus damnosus TaxID=51663 RepID=UPI00078D18FF|nr:hypothetical protein [Pediococcus damnosus]AMV60122.1 Hypothetical protein ADU69_0446 [Pediococcus damnosus]AMV64366.1 Hypothetical protein ADU71_0445 [Pediococcus damnosus]